MDPASAFSFDMSYCGRPPTPDDVWGRWNMDPVLIGVLVVAAILGALALRQAEGRRQLAFGAAWIVTTVLFVSPICALSVALLSVRVSHHVALAMLVAPLLALSLPADWRERAGQLPAVAVSTAVLWLWHAPDLYGSAFTHPAIYWAMQLSLLASFIWLWLALLRENGRLASGLAALASATQMGLLGALLVFAPRPLYTPHAATTTPFGLTALDDQHLAGLIMWVPANLPLMVLAAWLATRALAPRRVAPE